MNQLYIVIGSAILILIIIIWYISGSNKLKRMVVKIEEALSGIDIALTKRHDVLTKMVDIVKGYAKHEKETLFEVVNLRKEMSLTEMSNENKKMDENLQKLNMVVENYPKLKASENFMELEKAAADIEEHLQAARRCYNSNVSIYNQTVLSFPTSIIAKNKGMAEREFFEAEENDKENVEISI